MILRVQGVQPDRFARSGTILLQHYSTGKKITAMIINGNILLSIIRGRKKRISSCGISNTEQETDEGAQTS